jgi:hypothetical protein
MVESGCQAGRLVLDMLGMTADDSCRGPSKRLHLKWVLDKEDLRRKLRHFGGVIHERDIGRTQGLRTSEYGKLTLLPFSFVS